MTQWDYDLHIVFPVHKNPKVRQEVQRYLPDHERIHVIEPLEYQYFSYLMKDAYLIITDSWGIQEEAGALDIPVLVIRVTTERPEGLRTDSIRLVGTSKESILKEVRKLFDSNEYQRMVQAENPFGDGKTAKRIISILANDLV